MLSAYVSDHPRSSLNVLPASLHRQRSRRRGVGSTAMESVRRFSVFGRCVDQCVTRTPIGGASSRCITRLLAPDALQADPTRGSAGSVATLADRGRMAAANDTTSDTTNDKAVDGGESNGTATPRALAARGSTAQSERHLEGNTGTQQRRGGRERAIQANTNTATDCTRCRGPLLAETDRDDFRATITHEVCVITASNSNNQRILKVTHQVRPLSLYRTPCIDVKVSYGDS